MERTSKGRRWLSQRHHSRIYGWPACAESSPLDIAEDFYEASKLYPRTFGRQVRATRLYADESIGQSLSIASREMPHLARIPLVSASAPGEDGLLIRMSSAEQFMPKHVPIELVGKLLGMSYGMYRDEGANIGLSEKQQHDLRRRPVASGGGLYPLELYLLSQDPGGENSLFHYNPRDHCLEDLGRKIDTQTRLGLGPLSTVFGTAPMIVIIAGLIPRTRFMYGVTGYRLILMEAGAVTQQLQLSAQSLDLGSRPYMLYDQPVEALCGIDGVDEVFISAVLVGYERR